MPGADEDGWWPAAQEEDSQFGLRPTEEQTCCCRLDGFPSPPWLIFV